MIGAMITISRRSAEAMTTGLPSRVATAHPARRTMRWIVASLAVVVAATLGYQIVFARGLAQLRADAQQRLAIAAARLDGHIARFQYLPSLLETSPMVFRLLETPDDNALRRRVGLYLKSVNLLAGSENLYVLGVAGDAVAAADFEDEGTPVGRNLSYRPYFSGALASGRGAFFGVGITSARAGYYLSYALKQQGATRGVATVKVNLDSFEREWRDLAGGALLVDERGVTILASRDAWRYRATSPLTPAMQDDIARSKPYADHALAPLDWTIVDRSERGPTRVRIGDDSYTVSELAVNRGLWELMLLDNEAPARKAALIAGVTTGLVAVVAVLTLGLAMQRRREIAQRLANQAALKAANDQLESRVQERTAELRAAQDDLVHAGKLAALGQMSAGIVHELNQPLAALQTAADNAVVLIDRGIIDSARGNLVRVGELVRRLGRMTGQLRTFAYKSTGPLESVSIDRAVTEALKILAGRIRNEGVDLRTEIDSDLYVMADQTRLEQLICNIVANALDAVEPVADGTIAIRVARDEAQPGKCRIIIRNNGPAIADDIVRRMFEPFVTTKPAGKGLGLGLMLSNHIARSIGGELHGRNLKDGVEFAVFLPLAETAGAAAHE